MNATQIARLALYLAAAAAGLILVIIGALHDDMQLIGIGLPMLGYALPAANVKTSTGPDGDEFVEDVEGEPVGKHAA